MTNQAYHDFLRKKAILDPATGIEGELLIPEMMKPHQRDITKWALRRGRAAIFAGTGLGKTFMELVWADNVSEYTGKPVLIFAPLAVAAQHIREANKFGIHARIANSQDDVTTCPIVVTNYQKMDRFDLSQFGGIVLDECFAPDTMIDVISQSGKIKKRKISDIQVGDLIRNASGTDVVSDVHRREVKYGVRVSYGGEEIICSPNHPFFTRRGWVGAQDLKPGDQIVGTDTAMRILRGNVRDNEILAEEKTILQSILCSELADAATRNHFKNTHTGNRRKTRKKEIGVVSVRRSKGIGRNRTHSITQTHVFNESKAKGLPPIERHAAQTFRAWGQWSRDDLTAIGSEGCTVRQLAGGICFVTGSTQTRISNSLQNRLGERRKANSYRSGWSLTSIKKTDRREKGRNAEFIRVDGIEVLELGHPDLDRYRDAEGKLYFYDLGGTQHPSFSVNGGLVHNSSILKNSQGKYRNRLIEECKNIPFRLAATATPAPNDFMELGNHAEFLGVMSQTDMLAMFFTHDGGETQKWRLKGHAEDAFWRWMASWAVMLRNPADLGYPSDGYDLPDLIQKQHSVEVEYAPCIESGLLFPMEATTLGERLSARKDSVKDRVALAAEITPADRPFVWWCNLNSESEALAKAIPGAVEVRGSDKDEDKERKLVDFSEGRIRVLITKPSVAGFGMNWQHCADTGFVGLSDSFEQVYQAIRRFWRFGQTKPVNVHFIAAETEGAVVANIRRKEKDADRMANAMVKHMADFSGDNVRGLVRDRAQYIPQVQMQLPSWAMGDL